MTLLYQGDHTFSVQEQPDIRVVFSIEGDQAESVTVNQRGRSFTGARKQ